MSKKIKQMEMDALKATFKDVRDLVLLNATGLNAQVENQLRLDLRKKKIRLQRVKNSLVRRVFDELGMKLAETWNGPTTVAWGTSSLSELTRELRTIEKKNDKFKLKRALAEGQEVTIEQAEKMPTREEAIGRVISLAMSPARRLVSQILAPAGRIASQIKTLKEKTAEAAESAPAGPPAS